MYIYLLLISVLAAAVLLFFVMEKQDFTKALTVETFLSKHELFERETLYYTEIFSNPGILPIFRVRIDTVLPDGLVFAVDNHADVNTVSELVTIRSREQIRRVWKIRAAKRGKYKINQIRVIAPAFFGSQLYSHAVAVKEADHALTVFPATMDLSSCFHFSGNSCDAESALPKLLTDPIVKSFPRNYMPGDPFRSINWKLTATQSKLMVNTELPYDTRKLNLILNIQSRPREQHEFVPSSVGYTELAISVAAALICDLCESDTPMRIITNGKCDIGEEDRILLDRGRYFTSFTHQTSRSGILPLLDFLAGLDNHLTCTAGDLFTTLSDTLTDGTLNADHFVVVSPYFDSFLFEFHQTLKSLQIPAVYYLVSGRGDACTIPNDADIYYYTTK